MTSPHFSEPVLSVRNLEVSFPSEAGTVHAVRGIDCDLRPGQTLAIVGESGSGKSVTAMAIMGLLPEYAKVSGTVTVNGQSLLDLSDEQMSAVRGKQIGMIFQDPLSALTPVFDVGTQISEALLIHNTMTSQQAWNRAVELLGVVGIPDPERRAKSFPHEFSGGMRQRVLIAIAIANNPAVLIADEPTTALDVTIQAQILDLIKVAQQETQAATIMITHDMGVVAEMADEVIVMYAGRPIERGSVFDIFTTPRMPYTIGLLGSIPSLSAPKGTALTTIPGNPPKVIDLPEGCSFAPRCPIATDVCTTSEPFLNDVAQGHKAACHRAQDIAQGQVPATAIFPTPELPQDIFAGVSLQERSTVLNVEHLTKTFPLMKGGLLKRRVGSVYAVDDVSFSIKEGECFAIVGESGSGKSTTLLEIMDLQPEEETSITLRGEDVSGLTSRQRTLKRRDIQIVFQDPMGALDPRLTVEDILREPLDALGWEGDKDARIVELLELVGIDPLYRDRFPGHFSGGQRQRINVARALAVEPSLLVLDEPVSALDVSIQAGILNLLMELKATLGIALLIVAHDLSVIRHISDRAAVMYLGRFVEIGDTEQLFEQPRHPYTQALLSAIPIPDPQEARRRHRITLSDTQPAPTEKIPGCSFQSRCPVYVSLTSTQQEKCRSVRPEMLPTTKTQAHSYACHWGKEAGTLKRQQQ